MKINFRLFRVIHLFKELTASRSWQVLEGSDVPGFYELKRNKAIKTVWAIVFAILIQVKI